MGRVIILEGPDNIGKTWLAKLLATKHAAPYKHFGPPPKELKGKDQLAWQLGVLKKSMSVFEKNDSYLEIWDRSPIGESVYGPLYRSYDHEKYFDELKKQFGKVSKQIIVVAMYADTLTYRYFEIKQKEDEKEEYQTQKEATKIAIKFVDVIRQLELPHTVLVNSNNYKSFHDRNEYIVARIKAALHGRPYKFERTDDYSATFFNLHQRLWQEGSGFLPEFHAYECHEFSDETCAIGNDHVKLLNIEKKDAKPIGAIGAVTGIKYIFVGESSGYNAAGPQLCHPFYNGVSGCLFQTALLQLHILPVHYYLTNIVKCNPRGNKLEPYTVKRPLEKFECVKRLREELSMIYRKGHQVVAFGNVAARQLQKLDIPFEKVYHPAYYLRMGMEEQFVKDLEGAIRWKRLKK